MEIWYDSEDLPVIVLSILLRAENEVGRISFEKYSFDYICKEDSVQNVHELEWREMSPLKNPPQP